MRGRIFLPGMLVKLHTWFDEWCKTERIPYVPVKLWSQPFYVSNDTRIDVGAMLTKEIGIVLQIQNHNDERCDVLVMCNENIGWLDSDDIEWL